MLSRKMGKYFFRMWGTRSVVMRIPTQTWNERTASDEVVYAQSMSVNEYMNR